MDTFFDTYKSSDFTESYRIINTPSEFAKANLFYIQEAGSLKSLKSHINQRENLNSYLFLIVLSGSGHSSYNNILHKLNPGDCLLIDCKNYYSHQSSDEDPWELMWVHFNGKNVEPYISYLRNNNLGGIFHTDSVSDYTNIIETCLSVMKTNNIPAEFIISKMITDLLTFSVTRNTTTFIQNKTKKMSVIKEYINSNFMQKISLNEIALEFYISKYYLAREFKKFFGMTVGDYISVKRITCSKELLRFTNKTIEEISIICGIPDTNYFSKVFKKLEECSPTEYRKRW